MNGWISESANQWSGKPTNQWINESVSQWVNEPLDEWTPESMLQWINDWTNEWVDGLGGWMDGWATLLSDFFTEWPLHWGASSLSYFFSEQPLFWATSALSCLLRQPQEPLRRWYDDDDDDETMRFQKVPGRQRMTPPPKKKTTEKFSAGNCFPPPMEPHMAHQRPQHRPNIDPKWPNIAIHCPAWPPKWLRNNLQRNSFCVGGSFPPLKDLHGTP